MASRRIGQPKHRNEALRLALLGESSDFLDSSNTGVLDPFDVGTPASYLKGYNGIAAIRSGTGTQDLTVSGIGTPIALRWVLTKGSTLGTEASGMIFASGFAADDGTCHYGTISYQDADTNPMTGFRRQNSNGRVVIIAEDGVAKGIFTHDSDDASAGPITDGWRIDVTTETSLAGLQIAYTLYAGEGRSATVILEDGTTATNTTKHTVGFQPGIGHALSQGWSTQDTNGPACLLAHGMFSYDGSAIGQGSSEWGCFTGGATTAQSYWMSDDSIAAQTYGGAGAESRAWHAQVSAADATSFSITAVDGTTEAVGVLVLDVDPSQDVYCGNIQTPTDASVAWTETGPGFQPQSMTYLSGLAIAVDTMYSGSAAQGIMTGTVDSGGTAWTTANFSQDNVATSDARSMTSAQFMDGYADDGTVSGFDVISAAAPFTATGFEFSAAEVVKIDNQAGSGATARQMILLAIGA